MKKRTHWWIITSKSGLMYVNKLYPTRRLARLAARTVGFKVIKVVEAKRTCK